MPTRRPSAGAAASVLVCAALSNVAVAGCSNRQAAVNKEPHSGTATASPIDGVDQITVTSGVDLRFHPSTLVVRSGSRVRIVLVNAAKPGAGPPHNLIVSGLPGVAVPDAQAGQATSVTFTAPAPGKYSFVCSIHVRQNQTGTLIVR